MAKKIESVVRISLDQKNRYRILYVILIFGFLLRLGFSFSIGDDLRWYDEKNYDSIGVSIVEENGFYSSYNPYSTTHWAPLQGYFLAAVYYFFGHSPFTARIIQGLMSIFIGLLIFQMGRYYFTFSVGLISAFIFICHPLFIYVANLLYPVTIFTLLTLLVFLFLTKSSESQKLLFPILTGIFLGIAMLSKPVAIFFIPAIGLYFVLNNKFRLSKNLMYISLVLLFSGITISPWIVHNYFKYDKLYFITEEGAHSLVASNNSYFEMKSRSEIEMPDELEAKTENLDQDKRNKVYMQEAMNFIFENPLRFASNYFRKFISFWQIYPDTKSKNEDTNPRNRIIGALFYGVLLPLAFLGMVLSLSQWRKYILLFGFIFFFAFGYSLFIPSIRYRMPIEPFLLIFAAVAINWGFVKISNKLTTQRDVSNEHI